MILYDYFRSSASYRVRIALNLKQVPYELKEVHLVNHGGEQHSDAYKKLNPQELVPTLVDDDIVLTQSMAILEYLENKYPTPTLLPGSIEDIAHIRAVTNIVACDIHPLDNLRVLQYLKNKLSVSEEEKNVWYEHWIALGFAAIEKAIDDEGPFCFGQHISLADVCLIPQVYNAHRFACDMSAFPKISRVNNACLNLEAFKKASPEHK